MTFELKAASYETEKRESIWSKVMVMENLKTQGYKLVPKRIGLDLAHVKLLVDQVSTWHTFMAIMNICCYWSGTEKDICDPIISLINKFQL